MPPDRRPVHGRTVMDFPIIELMDHEACYQKLRDILHPQGLCCPRCGRTEGLGVHRRHRWPVLDYQCNACRCVFNAFTGTVFQGTHRPAGELMIILRGIAQGVTTAQLAREIKRNRPRLLELRHALQARALAGRDETSLVDAVAEVDEMYQNAGEKRHTPSRSRGSASSKSQQRQRPRYVGPGSATRIRDCRP